MKTRLFFVIVCLFWVLSSKAQLWMPASDSMSTIKFYPAVTFTDTITYLDNFTFTQDTATAVLDTAGCGIWQIGGSNKPVFSPVGSYLMHGIMTDTLGYYPINANSSFEINTNFQEPDIALAIWHKYETDSGHDGGIVEFSVDSGMNWANVVSCGGFYYFNGIYVENFYGPTDTLIGGEPAFSGNSGGEILSVVQIYNCPIPIRIMTSPCGWLDTGSHFPGRSPTIDFRFRFLSDSMPDSLSGWMIDSVKLYVTFCDLGSEIRKLANNIPVLYPNPADNVLNIQTGLNNYCGIVLYDILGRQILETKIEQPETQLNVSSLPAGVYQVVLMDADHQRYYERLVISH